MTWVRARGCHENGCCVEVARTPEAVLVRDSKLGDASPVLSFDVATWRAFVRGVRGA